ncbi:MAG: sulfite exporter TauE/SafE family protein [Amaricoccus sp.]|uniref:sulfite exporter TauE/SafE family protein n=1 Tax=Amaricoccus sp. TaxID=1872485 RepID=UPI0039E4E052
MTFLSIAMLFVAGFCSGAINAVAGGGTFITFAALSLVGVPPVMANATSSIAQFPGYVTSTIAYRDEIVHTLQTAIGLAILSAAGALAGALALLALDNSEFRAMVPWLLLAATGLFAAGPWLKPKRADGAHVAVLGPLSGRLVQFATAVYGGFFGAGMGVMMLATLGLTQPGDYHRLNALKNLLSVVIAAVAILVFVTGGLIAWTAAAVMIPAVALGGYSGVYAAKRVPQTALRGFVVVIGLALAVYYFLK